MKKILFTFCLILCFVACASYRTKIRNIELGMTKEQVVQIMGKSYENTGEKLVGEDVVKTISYKDEVRNKRFLLYFKDNRLIEWFVEELPKQTN